MSQILTVLSVWLHSLATVVFIGHFVLLSALYLPALQQAAPDAAGPLLSAISHRSRTLLYAALVIFFLTGGYLMLVNENYHGIGRFDNAWSLLMLVKHLVILVMIGLGFWNAVMRRLGQLAASNTGGPQAVAGYRRYANIMAVLAVLVLLLTALAQLA